MGGGGRKENAIRAKVKQKQKYSSFCNMQKLICKYIQLILYFYFATLQGE
jgi:hypothetical protein